jgi:RNA polymerase sigma factor (sigma-70 family)
LLRESRRDPDAFVVVCERHAGPLQRWLRGQTHDDHVVTELLAETFAEAWRVRRRFRDPGDGSARAWLFGIARNLLGHYRWEGTVAARARQRLGLQLERAPHDPFEELDERLSVAAGGDELHAAVAGLPAEQRAALELRVLDELAYDEVAKRLAVTRATARTRVFRALGALRTRMEGENR